MKDAEECGGHGRGGEREPFGAAINVAAKWQCHARLGPLWRPPTAKEPNEDFRLKGCVPYSGRGDGGGSGDKAHRVALARRTEVRLSPNPKPEDGPSRLRLCIFHRQLLSGF